MGWSLWQKLPRKLNIGLHRVDGEPAAWTIPSVFGMAASSSNYLFAGDSYCFSRVMNDTACVGASKTSDTRLPADLTLATGQNSSN